MKRDSLSPSKHKTTKNKRLSLKNIISKIVTPGHKKIELKEGSEEVSAPRSEISPQKYAAKMPAKKAASSFKMKEDISTRKIRIEESTEIKKEEIPLPHERPLEAEYRLPLRYGDNSITLLPRDPWWLHTYWDISEARINEVISAIPVYEREGFKWILRVYDLTGVKDLSNLGSTSFFDIDIHFEANSWYINVQQPEREWCVEIGLKNALGKFFPIARSNVIKTPYFGISPVIDEEWVLPDEEYYKVLGVYELGKSSLERKKKFEELMKRQISSPLASWGISSLFSERKPAKLQDKFFLEVWTELILYGRTEPDAELTVEGAKIKLRPDGTFSQRYSLPPGDFRFNVTAISKNRKHIRKRMPAVKRYGKDSFEEKPEDIKQLISF